MGNGRANQHMTAGGGCSCVCCAAVLWKRWREGGEEGSRCVPVLMQLLPIMIIFWVIPLRGLMSLSFLAVIFFLRTRSFFIFFASHSGFACSGFTCSALPALALGPGPTLLATLRPGESALRRNWPRTTLSRCSRCQMRSSERPPGCHYFHYRHCCSPHLPRLQCRPVKRRARTHTHTHTHTTHTHTHTHTHHIHTRNPPREPTQST